MIPATQYRTGENGTCFRSCVASILNMPEHQVLDFDKDTNGSLEKYWRNVGSFLARYGLRYFRVPIGGAKPVGWSTIEGISPRGGPHACVAYNGKLVHDPHPQDGTGRGLVEPRYYGVLKQLAGGKAKDAADVRIAWRVKPWPGATEYCSVAVESGLV